MTPHVFARRHLWRKLAFWGWLAGSLVLPAGCVSRAPLTKQSFAFPLGPLKGVHTRGEGPVLKISRIRVAAPYDTQSFIYRTGPFSFERDPYAEFLVAPEEAFLEPIQSWLMDSGQFGEVVAEDSYSKPDLTVEVFIPALYGDFQDRQSPAAVMRMRFIFNRADRGASGHPLMDKAYEQRIPFRQRTAAALMQAWNEALKRVMASLKVDCERELGRDKLEPSRPR